MKHPAVARKPAQRRAATRARGLAAAGPGHDRLVTLQQAADAGSPVARLMALQQAAGPLQLARGGLVTAHGRTYKKKDKQRREAEKVEKTLDKQLHDWVDGYGHAEERHAGRTTQQLDDRNIPLATTFETRDDLFRAAKDVITVNEQKINHWFENSEEDRLSMWSYRPDEVEVRGRRKQKRPDWHQYANPMPPHPGHANVDPDELPYIVAIFDRDSWNGNPMGLITCFPSETTPH
ncbi:RNase A-like domain-containing protein [Paracoccus marinaquae]|uniref:Uncharacterized protein n=1 Tax=Paracoccus marinaquae TaxID=2841926 RepID=A0ABS6AD87_9RHOB|nr:RNase A-like domain-containing protein [Paracoccus marinaquae]MBU3028562.1 hypothetical protein [Paracoccus marinaquae]